MTLKEILDLKEQGYTLDEIERINEILESTGTEDDPKPEDDLKPDPGKSDPEPAKAEPNVSSDVDSDPEPDYKKMYEDLKEKTEKGAARKDLSGEDEKQLEIQDAVAAFFKSKFS